MKKKSRAIPLGIFAGMMFLPAPLFGTGLLMYLSLPSTRRMIEAWNEKEE